ncbi:MAG TPA: FAD:protein FMN transferase [Bacteroidales bacterium]|nr:MAG: Thiamine biosynthesis lipoprotein ApbE precursor [Bacteroidetes bacterium ADurb.Bin090]HQB71011.1 FAD:protein FMN transferase [Bacteroidales bacterium]HQP23283.1 FAD:protein FMN transferase [Bacteroidales bacterium]
MKTRLFFPILLLMLVSCKDKTVFQRNQGFIFNTSYHISYTSAKDLHATIRQELEAFDASLSMFNPESTISRINRGDTLAIDLSGDPRVVHLLNEALKISQITEGAFDMTVAPLVDAWGFGTTQRKSPGSLNIDSLMQFVGYDKLRLVGFKLSKADARVKLDASAIAKGYACDIIAERLEQAGIEDYLVEIGGEIRMAGHNPKGLLWKVGIDKPLDDSLAVERELQAALALTGKGLATSGNYRNFYKFRDQKLAHTIDPRSGKPIQQNILSATVVASNALTADAYATAFMVMGLEKACALTDSLPGLEAYFIYSDSEGKVQTWISESLQGALTTF